MLSAAVSRAVLGQHAARRLYPFTLGSCCLRLVPSISSPPREIPPPPPNPPPQPYPLSFPSSVFPSFLSESRAPPLLPAPVSLLSNLPCPFFTSTPPERLPITLQSVMPSHSLCLSLPLPSSLCPYLLSNCLSAVGAAAP